MLDDDHSFPWLPVQGRESLGKLRDGGAREGGGVRIALLMKNNCIGTEGRGKRRLL
jgi:hypothetical protein